MNKLMIVATITAMTALFSSVATAKSGLADRISDVSSYPDKTVSTKNSHTHCKDHKKYEVDIIKSERGFEQNN